MAKAYLYMFVEPCPAILQSLKRESLVLYCTDHRLARKTIKYIGLLIALLPQSKINKNTIFKVLYLQLYLVVKTRNAKPTWQHTIIDGCCDGVNRHSFRVPCKTSLTCYRQKTVRNCLIFCPPFPKTWNTLSDSKGSHLIPETEIGFITMQNLVKSYR